MSRPTTPPTLTAAQENLLDHRLDLLRRESASLSAPPALEASLMAAFKARHAPRRPGFFAQWFAPGVALAASVGMSAWMVLSPMARPALDPAHLQAPAAAADMPFIALQPLAEIEAEREPRLIETRVPRAWLASYGVPVGPEVAGDSLRAEMLVNAGGQPLAMRFLP